MYHPHFDEMTQMAMGMMGFFIIHPQQPEDPPVDRDFAIFLAEWYIKPGTYTPNPTVMLDFNYFTFNSRVSPGTDPLVVRLGQRVRIRFANLSMDTHPIHLHGGPFWVTGTSGGRIPRSAWIPEDTVNVPVGSTRDIEYIADEPGDWALHCHKTHHTMSGMQHGLPNIIGVDSAGVDEEIRQLLPEYMTMGQHGMADMFEMKGMPGPVNFAGTGTQQGPFGIIDMGGMFTVVKVREGITGYEEPGWYKHPAGTVPHDVATSGSAQTRPAMEHERMK